MNIRYLTAVLVCISASACNTNTFKNSTDPEKYADSIRHYGLNQLKITNEKDPVCGMPTLRGFEDTTVYQGKLIGFCSRECKDSFVKNPVAYKITFK